MPIIWALGQGTPSLPPSGSGRAGNSLVALANRVHRQLRDGEVLLNKFVGHVMERTLDRENPLLLQVSFMHVRVPADRKHTTKDHSGIKMKNVLGRLAASLCLPALTLVSTASVAHAAETQQYVVPNQSINSELTTPGTVKDIRIQAVSNDREENEENKVDTPSGIQLEWQIESPEDDHQRSYEIEADGKVELSIDQPSGALLVKVDGVNTALINAPWAHDANGQSLPTHYEVEGNVFTQVVETDGLDVSYPITADPRVNWGIVSGHVYFSKEETRRMAASTAAGAAITPFWVLVPPPFGEALGVWWAQNMLNVTLWATGATAQDKCLALKVGATGSVTPPSLGITPEHYTEGCA